MPKNRTKIGNIEFCGKLGSKLQNILLSRKSLRYLKKEQAVFAEIVLKKELVYKERH